MSLPSNGPFLDTITVLPVRDIAASCAWYKATLGFETVYLHEGEHAGEATNYAVLRRGAVDVHLILDEPPPHRAEWTVAGRGYLYLLARDVDAIHREATSAGAAVTRGLQTESWGARAFNLADPSGNAIHVEQAR